MIKVCRRFTLIELLVVIAIIGILASILLPSLHKSREKVLMASCMNNQRNITMGVEMYIDSNDSRTDWRKNHQKWLDGATHLTQADNDAYWGVTYGDLLTNSNPYESIAVLFKCPKAKEVDPWVDFEINGQFTTYGFNGVENNGKQSFFEDDGWTGSAPKSVSTIENPSEIIMMQDAYESMLDGNGDTPISLTQWPNYTHEYFRHLNKTVVLWSDGHASYKTKSYWTWTMYVQ